VKVAKAAKEPINRAAISDELFTQTKRKATKKTSNEVEIWLLLKSK
jgi:hypothetical protein